MNIQSIIPILKAEKNFNRTPIGRSITENGVAAINATLQDNKNWHMDAQECVSCGYVNSSLQFPEGCPNCNVKFKLRS